MKVIARYSSAVLLSVFLFSTAHAQRTTTLSDETNNNTSGCGVANSSYVGPTSCQATFPGARDDASAGTDQNAGANTVVFDAAPSNVADFTHDGVDIHSLVYPGFNGKIFANVLLWHAGPPFNYTPKNPGPENTKNGHFSVGYTSDDSNQVAAELAFLQRLNIDGIVANPPGPLPPRTSGQNANDAAVNDTLFKWKAAADATPGFLFSVMTDHQTWDGNSICNGNGANAHGNFDPVCVEKVMTCSLDFLNTATTSSFVCALDGISYAGGGFFNDTHYWTVSGHPVLSYFMDESTYFGTRCTAGTPCAVFNDNVPGTTCTSSSDCWNKIFAGISHHINAFAVRPFIIYRDNFNLHPTPNDGSFRWFNGSTDQTFTDILNGPVDDCAYDCWLHNAVTLNPSVALGVGLAKTDHAQSPFPTEIGDHHLIDAQCGKTWLTYLKEPGTQGFGTGHQLQALEIATFDDYDEGTETETGIDNCVSSFSASLTGTTVSWSILFNAPGDESTIDHYAIFYSTDGSTGQNLTLLTNVAVNSANGGNYSFDVGTGLPSPTVIYVKAVGKSMVTNHIAEAGLCDSCGASTPSTGTVTVGQLGQLVECPPQGDFPWTMTITVNNVTDTWTLDCATTPKVPSALAADWAAQINADPLGTLVTATASGNVITLTSIAKGSNTNYPLAAVDNYTAEGWFPLTASGPTMTGGH